MSGEITLKKNTTNTQSTNNEESNKVHYHLSANVKFDKENAFNGGETKIDGSWVNSNLETDFDIESFNVTIKHWKKKNYINSSNNNIDIFKDYDYIEINGNKKQLIKFEDQSKNTNILISDFEDKIEDKTFDFYLQSKDNKGNIDKTKAGNTYNIFAKNQTVEGEPPIQQFYHGGSGRKLNNETKQAYNQDLIKEKQSFTLFYTRENIRDLNNENSILIGLGEIQNKIGVLDTSDRIEGSKIYCYDHYEINKNKKLKYHLFRFPYQELIHIANNNVNNQKDSAKQFLEELIEPLSIENSDKPFFSYEQSKIIPNALVLKYANRLYEQIMKLKQNKTLWEAVKNASNGKNWHFCDDYSIEILKDSIEKLKKAQLTQKNPGLWALKDFLHISNEASEIEIILNDEYENFIEICSGKIVENFNLYKLFNTSNDQYELKNYIMQNLINYPINNPETIKRIFLHLGIKIEITKNNEYNFFFKYNISNFKIEEMSLSVLVEKVKNNINLYDQKKSIYTDPEHKINAINRYLENKSTLFSFNQNLLNENNFDSLCLNLVINKIENIEEVLENPYLLFEKYIQNDDAPLLLDDIDWGQKIIQKSNFNTNNIFRLRAIVVEYIKIQENQSGHVWVSYEDAQEYLNDRLYELDNKLEKFYKIVDLIDKDEFKEVFEKDNQFLTLKEFASREKYIKSVIENLINKSSGLTEEQLEEDINIEDENYIESEKSLIKMKKLDFVFISGVAGSGKSHTLCKYLDYLAENEITDFQVLTPSGKAANVIKNKIKNDNENFNFIKEINDLDKKISTADKYIVKSTIYWNQRLFSKVDYNPSATPNNELDVLIIDEISMIPLDILYYILKIKTPKKLIILGDIKQLPPIGYGSLAKSIYNYLSKGENICLAKMEKSHRADGKSLFINHSLTLRHEDSQLKENDLKKNIIEEPQQIDNIQSSQNFDNFYETKFLALQEENKNFILLPYSNEQKLKFIIEKIYKIENSFNENFRENIEAKIKDIQILTPNRIGDSGTCAINDIFTKEFKNNKKCLKFIYIKNEKDEVLSNGTIGFLIEKDQNENTTNTKDIINFEGEEVVFDKTQLGNKYEYGFAITVHKSQGSGFPIVILVLPKENNSLITKELIYTALTRPEKKMYILYHKDNIEALTQLPSIPHRNMNLFDTDKKLWIKDKIEYPIKHNGIEYRKKQDLYFALMLEYSGKKITENDVYSNNVVKYYKNGSFVFNDDRNEEMLLMPKFYIEEKQDEKSFKYLKSINLRKVYKNFKFKLGDIQYEKLQARDNENKVDIIEDNNNSIEITTHNGLRTRSWSEAILMLIFDKLKIPYYYEVELRRENETNSYKLTYPNPGKQDYRIPDFTISTEKVVFPKKDDAIPTSKEELISKNEPFDIRKDEYVELKTTKVKCIIEHLGMLKNKEYRDGWQKKVKDYYNEYKFDLVAPLSSLSKVKDGSYKISQKWENEDVELGKYYRTKQLKTFTINSNNKHMNICFTTDEKDFKNLQTLTQKLVLLQELYKLNNEEE
ncbi:ATP-dependent DNA helicase [Aliarcobacter cryaerophilus]|uniref:ATP-dependent DNA helicase n=1 Tax=Aliarcobacter cryaerophilus TaxID=28198 RepID=UPI003DA31139